jgi:general stress protein CsbA
MLYTVLLVPSFLRLPGVSRSSSQISTDVVSLFAGHIILIWAIRHLIRWRLSQSLVVVAWHLKDFSSSALLLGYILADKQLKGKENAQDDCPRSLVL